MFAPARRLKLRESGVASSTPAPNESTLNPSARAEKGLVPTSVLPFAAVVIGRRDARPLDGSASESIDELSDRNCPDLSILAATVCSEGIDRKSTRLNSSHIT